MEPVGEGGCLTGAVACTTTTWTVACTMWDGTVVYTANRAHYHHIYKQLADICLHDILRLAVGDLLPSKQRLTWDSIFSISLEWACSPVYQPVPSHSLCAASTSSRTSCLWKGTAWFSKLKYMGVHSVTLYSSIHQSSIIPSPLIHLTCDRICFTATTWWWKLCYSTLTCSVSTVSNCSAILIRNWMCST